MPVELYMDSANPTDFTAVEWYEYQVYSDYISLGLDKNMGLTMLILGFVIGMAALLIVYRFLHKKPLLHLFTGYHKIRWKHVCFVLVAWGSLCLLLLFGQLLTSPEDYAWQFDASKFIPLLLICILMRRSIFDLGIKLFYWASYAFLKYDMLLCAHLFAL
jgi:H+/Cl- antiporter ClcA